MGDFNDVLGQEEKSRGRLVNQKSNFFLKNFMLDLGALDLGFFGNLFT